MDLPMKDYLRVLSEGRTLSEPEAEGAMRLLMHGESTPEETAGFLMGLRSRGETVDELVGFTRVMRSVAVHVDPADTKAIDLCGTGGDQAGTFNISTCVAIVCAGAGATVAKHGNRSVSSRSGSADVLEALGVTTELGKDGVETCLREVGLAFLFAPFFHPAMRYVMPVRRALGVRTFFNILGPLCNPAGVRRQLVGAFDLGVAEQMARILARLGVDHAIVVHSESGLDEIGLDGPTTAFHARSGSPEIETERIDPQSLGFRLVSQDELRGGSADENARIVDAVLDGEDVPARDVVLINAAYGLLCGGRHGTLAQCLEAAAASIDSGAARNKLTALVEVSRSCRATGP